MPADLLRQRNASGTVILVAVLLALQVIAVPSHARPTTAEEAVAHATALESQGLVREAETYLVELIETEPELANEAAVLVRLAELTSDIPYGQELLGRVIETTRNDGLLARAHALRADYMFTTRRYVSAAREYEKAARHSRGGRAAAALLRRADCLLAADDASNAAAAYREAIEGGDLDPTARARAELGIARSFLQRNQPNVAAAHFSRMAEEYDDEAVRLTAMSAAAESYERAGAVDKALRLLTELIETYPDSFEAVLALGRLPELEGLSAARADTLSGEPGAPVQTDD